MVNEPPHDKTNNVAVRLLKTQISLGCLHEESLGPKLPIEHTAKTLIRLGGCLGWSESSLGTHSFCWFCYEVAQIVLLLLPVNQADACLDKLYWQPLIGNETGCFLRFVDRRRKWNLAHVREILLLLHWKFCTKILIPLQVTVKRIWQFLY